MACCSFLDTEEVRGSNPRAPTGIPAGSSAALALDPGRRRKLGLQRRGPRNLGVGYGPQSPRRSSLARRTMAGRGRQGRRAVRPLNLEDGPVRLRPGARRVPRRHLRVEKGGPGRIARTVVKIIVLDTDVASRLQRGTVPLDHLSALRTGTAAITFVTVADMFKGAFKAAWRQSRIGQLEAWLAAWPVLPYDATVSRVWGRLI